MGHQINKIVKRHQYVARISTAFIYAVLVSIAMNLFWTPGHIYASGVTGAAQVAATVLKRFFSMDVSVAILLFALNIPLFVLAWKAISPRFTIFTIISVGLASIMIKWIHPVTLTTDRLSVLSLVGQLTVTEPD